LAKGSRYRVPYKRRRKHKTDYKARRILAVSEKPRFVVRFSNRNIIVQIVESKIEGDYVLAKTHSKELSNYGWKISGKNSSAAYLLGLISGYKALAKNIDSANLDIGLKRPTLGSRIFALVKGANEVGLNITVDSDVIPPPEKISGEKIAEFSRNIQDPFEYEKIFSKYLRSGVQPENIPEHFLQVKEKILEAYN
jgi:large subunit ribosomal protein L18